MLAYMWLCRLVVGVFMSVSNVVSSNVVDESTKENALIDYAKRLVVSRVFLDKFFLVESNAARTLELKEVINSSFFQELFSKNNAFVSLVSGIKNGTYTTHRDVTYYVLSNDEISSTVEDSYGILVQLVTDKEDYINKAVGIVKEGILRQNKDTRIDIS